MSQSGRTALLDKMSSIDYQARLRERAVSRLAGLDPGDDLPLGGAAAMRALYGMAFSPATAPDALALLHELQVHQVELDLQAEELQRAWLEFETTLRRHAQMVDYAPVALCTIDPGTTLRELNAIGAKMLGAPRDALLGRPLVGFLEPRSAKALPEMLARADAASSSDPGTLELVPVRGAPRIVLARASVDPDGCGYCVALMESGAQHRADADSSTR